MVEVWKTNPTKSVLEVIKYTQSEQQWVSNNKFSDCLLIHYSSNSLQEKFYKHIIMQ